MPTLRLIVRYDGMHLSGWQRQPGVRTVQQSLEQAIESMTATPTRVAGAGRTDAGVHAYAQVAAFKTESKISCMGWRLGLNSKLPKDVAVTDVRVVQDDYDPRRASGGKRYRYLICNTPTRDPMLRDRAWHIHQPLDVERMQEAAKPLVGTHDFAGFRASDCERMSTKRTLFRVEILRDFRGSLGLIAIEVEGTAFLKNMVRIIAGTLVDIGRNRLAVTTLADVLAHGDRTKAGITAVAHGLYLDEVFVRAEYRLPDDVLNLRPAYADRILGIEPDDAALDESDDGADEG
ncbi:MAG: tRNA pseudouridine(38-40) synthase TruA [Deltaproteobacteria bacterium]|nr:tRNA pseudouridine(38-40) synthase TruA [Deltaproteobacteria bacterium]